MAFVTLTKEIAEELASKAGNRDYKVTIEGGLVAYVQLLYDGNGSINVHMDADVDEKMWLFWDHNYQSGVESVSITYCTRYNGCHFKVKDDESVDDAILEKLEESCEDICDHLGDDCNEDGDYYGSEGDAIEYITNIVQRTVGTNTQVKVRFDHYSS